MPMFEESTLGGAGVMKRSGSDGGTCVMPVRRNWANGVAMWDKKFNGWPVLMALIRSA
jgi:hypothetical protein